MLRFGTGNREPENRQQAITDGRRKQWQANRPNPAARFLLWVTDLAQRVGSHPPAGIPRTLAARAAHARGLAAWRELVRDGPRPALSNIRQR